MENLEATLSHYAFVVLIIGCILLCVLAVIGLKARPLTHSLKKVLFAGMALSVLLPTAFLIVSTVYLNTISSSKGPVHWHADFEIWACGKELELKNPKGLSNKVGTPTLHEHNDKRIHLEGVVVTPTDASLGKFFSVIGGKMTNDTLAVPTEHELQTYRNGEACQENTQAELQVFVYKAQGDTYSQQKVTDPAHYIMAPESAVPSGDCIIIEFDVLKDRTDHLCRSYAVAKEIGKLKGETTRGY